MSKEIKKYDNNGNLIYYKNSNGEYWYEYNKNNNRIYFKTSDGYESWYKYNENNNRIIITEKEYKEIKYNKKIKEYNSRTKCSRFELMEI